LADYAWQQVRKCGKSISQVVADLRAGPRGMPGLTKTELEHWMRVSVPEAVPDDPFGGERDETRRAERLEQRIAKAAETTPGAAELIGIDRFIQTEDQPELRELMVEIVRRLLDFLVPELVQDEHRYVHTRIALPSGWTWECWDGGSRHVLSSALALHNADGHLSRLYLRTRPRGQVFRCTYSTYIPVRYATLAIQADKEGVAQRIIQVAQEFRAERHGRITQSELAHACERTKQAISHQRLLMWNKVQTATGGRANSPGLRNLGLRRASSAGPAFPSIFDEPA
jgi:hypothetical protein